MARAPSSEIGIEIGSQIGPEIPPGGNETQTQIESRVRDTRVRDTRVRDTRVRDTRVRDTRMRDTRVRDTRMRDTRMQGEPPLQLWPDAAAAVVAMTRERLRGSEPAQPPNTK